MNLIDASLLTLFVTVCLGLLTWFSGWRSQKIAQENFYAEPFLKVKAERIIKALDLLNIMKFYLCNYNKYPESCSNIDTLKITTEYRETVLLLHGYMDKENLNKLINFWNEITKTNTEKEDINSFSKCHEDAVNMLEKFIPNDVMIRR